MIKKIVYKIVLSGMVFFTFFSCAQLQKKYIYNTGEVKQDIFSEIISNEIIETQDRNSANIKGNILINKDGLPGIIIIFQNIENLKKHKALTNFDGFYDIDIPTGEYSLKMDYNGQVSSLNDTATGNKTVFEFNSGEIRKLDWRISLGYETSISYSIEFKNKKAYEKALKKAKELNMSLLEYTRLEKK